MESMESASFSATAVTIQKILQILAVLRGLPAGGAVHYQVEQLLTHLQQETIRTEQAYAVMLHRLLEPLLQHFPETSSEHTRIRILQTRLQPPLLAEDMDAILEQEEQLAEQVCHMPDRVKQQLSDTITSLYEREHTEDTPASFARLSKKPPLPDAEYARAFDPGLPDGAVRDALFYEDIHVANELQPRKSIELEAKASLTRELKQSIALGESCGVTLDEVMQELQGDLQDDGVELMRSRLLKYMKQLQKNHYILTESLEKTYLFLSSVEIDRRQLDKELSRARLLSLTDELTDLPNRRAFLNRLEDEVGRVKRHKLPLCMAILDLDGFKEVNDTCGHSVGDEVLRCYAQEVFSTFRQYDLVARYGGEEFAVLLPNTDRDGGIRALRKVRMRVDELRKKYQERNLPIPSFSAGLAVYADGESISNYIERADQAMYRAKSLGRNRVEVDAA